MKKDNRNPFKGLFRHLKSFAWLSDYTKPFTSSILLLLVLNIIISTAGIASSVASKYVVDSASSSGKMLISVLFMVAFTGVAIAANFIFSLLSTVVNEKYASHIRLKLLDQMLRTEWLEISKYHSGDVLTRLKSDVNIVAGGISELIPQIAFLTVQLVISFFTLNYYDSTLAIFAVILGPMAVLVSWSIRRKLRQIQTNVQEAESRYSTFLQESLENILIIKSFVAEDDSAEKFSGLLNARIYWIKKKNRLTAIAGAIISIFFSLGYLVAFVWGAYKISKGLITFGTMTIFLSLASRIQGPIYSLAKTIPQLSTIEASADRINELRKLPLESQNSEATLTEIVNVGIEFQNVAFGYTEDVVLDNIKLKITPGDFVAVVGVSGVGKTTLVRLIMSLIQPNEGSIDFLMNGSFTMSAQRAARSIIAYVPQGNTLFSGTIAENLKMGNPDATKEDMRAALNSAAADFVFTLPDGLDTVIGERGKRLSDGQAQRIAIARAIIRRAPLLILDEATSSLDLDTEYQVLQKLRSLDYHPTCIIVTHRESILSFCNRKIVIEQGKIVEKLPS